MEACTVFSSRIDYASAHDALVELLGEKAITLTGTREHWEEIILKRRRFLGKVVLRLVPKESGPELDGMRKGMQFVFSSVPTSHTGIRKAVVNRIDGVQFGIGISAKRLIAMEDIVFALAKALDGFIFWDNKQILNPKGGLVLDTEGYCRVKEFDGVKMADTDDSSSLAEQDNARKLRSEAFLKARKIPFHAGLPPAFLEGEAAPRPQEAIANRCMALIVVALRGEGLEKEITEKILDDYGLHGFLSQWEKEFLAQESPDTQVRIDATWRYEAAWMLLWVLGKVDSLQFPDTICDPATVVGFLKNAGSADQFRQNCKLRPLSALMDEADLTLRLHWAVVSARLKKEASPANLEGSVVLERHHALNWTLGLGENWDSVPTDT